MHATARLRLRRWQASGVLHSPTSGDPGNYSMLGSSAPYGTSFSAAYYRKRLPVGMRTRMQPHFISRIAGNAVILFSNDRGAEYDGPGLIAA